MAVRRPEQWLAWATDTFGRIALNRRERMMRFLEEAIELAHADGASILEVDRLMWRVYGRPRGEVRQEIGQALATLETFAESIGVCADDESARELERVKSIPKEEWHKRHALKAKAGIATAIE